MGLVSCGKTAVKTRAFRSEIIHNERDSSRNEACACAQLIIRIKIRARFARDFAVPLHSPSDAPVMREGTIYIVSIVYSCKSLPVLRGVHCRQRLLVN